MSEPENFLLRWSRRKREADTAPQAENPATPDRPETPPAAAPAEEPAFDLAKLPSLDEIAAGTDMSVFMKAGVPTALRHAALRRAWVSDPAIRDFRGLQENDWDFNAPEGVPGFGTFKSEEEIEALAQRLFGPARPHDQPVPQSPPEDSAESAGEETSTPGGEILDKNHGAAALAIENTPEDGNAEAVHHDDDVAAQRGTARRHGGALPQ